MQLAAGPFNGTLPAITGSLNGTVAYYNAGSISGTLPYPLSGLFRNTLILNARDSFNVTSENTINPYYAAVEALQVLDTPSLQAVLSFLGEDSISLEDAIWYTVAVIASESFNLASSPSGSVAATLLVAELLTLVSETSTSLTVGETLTEALAAVDVLTWVAVADVEETLALADSLTAAIRAQFQASETIALAEEISYSFNIITSENISIEDVATGGLVTALLAEDTIAFVGKLPLEDGDYSAWVMNAETTGATTYSNFPFNSLLTHENRSYGVTETGLYELTGTDDDGTDIDWSIRTGDINFRSSKDKRTIRAYIYALTDGSLTLKTVSSDFGARTERNYLIEPRASDSQDDETFRMVKLSRGLQGIWWSFELTSVDGSTVDFKGAEVLPVILVRRG